MTSTNAPYGYRKDGRPKRAPGRKTSPSRRGPRADDNVAIAAVMIDRLMPLLETLVGKVKPVEKSAQESLCEALAMAERYVRSQPLVMVLRRELAQTIIRQFNLVYPKDLLALVTLDTAPAGADDHELPLAEPCRGACASLGDAGLATSAPPF